MTDAPTTRMLVLVDAPGRADAVLSLGERYATTAQTLTPTGIDSAAPLTTAVGGEARTVLSPMIDQLLHTAAEHQIPWVGIRRDLAPPADLLRELLVATGRHSSEAVPGFAVFLAQGEVPPLRRILAIVDRSHGPISGLLAHTAVTVAEAAGAELDILILAAHGEDLSAEDELEALAINRERELYEQAVARASAVDLKVNWLTAAGVADSWTVVTNQMMQTRYDLVIDDLGDVALGGALRRGSALDQVLSPGQMGEIPLRLLTEYFGPVLLVIDGIRLGMTPAALLRAGAVAALAIGVVSSGLAPGLTATVSQAAQMGGPDPVDELRSELQDALATNATDRATRAQSASRSTTRAAAVSSGKAPTAPKGGADPSDVERAKVELRSSETRLRKAQRSLNRARTRLAEAKDDRDAAQEHVVSALAELESAQAAKAERDDAAQRAREDASGLTGILPGGTSRSDADIAEARAQVAGFRLDRAIQEGEEALADLDAADQQVERATELLNIARARIAKLNAEYAFDKQTVQVYRESLADSRQAPVRSGSYRITARFGQAGGLWSSGYHTGLDFAGASGTDISAAASGTVVSAGWAGAYGNRIEIDHGGGVHTTYNHLSRINVSLGQKVYTGDHIGDLGSTGNSTGPHLHFEVTRNGSFIDPQAWLGW